MEYRILQEQEIARDLFHTFIRHQVVDQCLRRENGGWVVRSDPFVDDWSEDEYRSLMGSQAVGLYDSEERSFWFITKEEPAMEQLEDTIR